MHKISLFIFRRDLRLIDNTALIEASKNSKKVVLAFIFNPRQLEKENKYFSRKAFTFLIESLEELQRMVKNYGGYLNVLYGNPSEVLARIFSEKSIDAVYINKDYTPFSIDRDKELSKICARQKIQFNTFDDALLHPPGSVRKSNNQPYTTFNSFARKARNMKFCETSTYVVKNISPEVLSSSDPSILNKFPKEKLFYPAGRNAGLRALLDLPKNYSSQRDIPAKNSTAHLSSHHKFGTVSIRETHFAALNTYGADSQFESELLWRDFFTHIAYFFPRVFGSSFQEKYKHIPWINSREKFDAWCSGRTGVPIVDAGMRELSQTGFMHNRVRMIVCSYLVKNLHIDWRWGEQHFAQSLVDYDPSVNNGNWQWGAGTGCDAAPYFRIFNPWRQHEKFDPDWEYVCRWLKELSSMKKEEKTMALKSFDTKLLQEKYDYPPPLVDLKTSADKTRTMFKKVGEQK